MVAARRQTDDRSTVTYWPRGASADLFTHHESEVVVAGPAGTGKTYGCLWRLHLAALKYPGMRGIMLRKVQEDLTASALVTYQTRVLGTGNFGVRLFGGSKIKPAGFQYPNGAELLMGGLDKADKVMSREYDLIYVNEATELEQEDWENLTTRTRWGVMPYQQTFGDCNPQGPTHWLYQRHIAGSLSLLNSVHEDNPVLYNGTDWTPEGQAYLGKLDKLTGHRRQRLRHGLWVAAEGMVYPDFTRATHVKTVDCTGWASALAMDIGASNPTCVLTVRYAGDRLHIEHEIYDPMHATAMLDAAEGEYKRTKAEFLVIDPSALLLVDDLQARGIRVRKGQNAVVVGINRVTSALPNLSVDPSCVNTIGEFESYHYPKGQTNGDQPVKRNDHAMDPLRYLVMELTDEARMVSAVPQGMLQTSDWR